MTHHFSPASRLPGADVAAGAGRMRYLRVAIYVLLAMKAVAWWIGYDRLPMLSNSDEVLIADQAVSWARGEGLRAASFAGLSIGDFYAHHPPVYSALAALAFWSWGFNAFTLRGLPILAYTIVLVLMVKLLRRLRAQGWVDELGVVLVLLLLATDFLSASFVRFGRMDAVEILFGVAALYVLVRHPAFPRPARGTVAMSAVLVGLSLSTYIGAIYLALAWGMLILLLPFARPIARLGFGAAPLAVFALVWVATYRERAWQGLLQMREIADSMVAPGSGLAWWTDGLRHGDWRTVMQAGGLTLLLALALSGFIVVVGGRALGRRSGGQKGAILWAVAAVGGIWVATWLLTGGGRGKLLSYFPLLLIAFALVLPAAGVIGRRLAIVGCAVMAFAGFLMSGGYVATAIRGWHARAPERFATLVGRLPPDAKVAAVPQFWFTFRRVERPVRVVDYGFGPDRVYWSSRPERFDAYDYVLLQEGHDALAYPSLARWPREAFPFADFTVYLLKNPQSRTAAP